MVEKNIITKHCDCFLKNIEQIKSNKSKIKIVQINID